MECLYLPDIDIDSKEIVIEGDEFHHLKVLRVYPNDNILISNGKGLICEVKVNEITKIAKATVIKQQCFEKHKFKTAIALGILDNRDRFEFALEKCIELGISDFFPITCKFSQKKTLNINRLELKSISALKQSKQAWKTQIHQPIDIKNIFSTEFDNYFYADMDSKAKVQAKNGDNLIIIGPEGGFSDDEVEFLHNNEKLIPFTLGTNRLRAETAAISSVAILNYLFL